MERTEFVAVAYAPNGRWACCAACYRPIHEEKGWPDQHCTCEPPLKTPGDMETFVRAAEADAVIAAERTRRIGAERGLRRLADIHHRTIRGSQKHDPENRDWWECDCKTCAAVRGHFHHYERSEDG